MRKALRTAIFYQKPNWAAVSFSVSAERFRAASSLSETGVLMVLLTPLTVEEGRHGHADVGDAVEVLEHGAHGQDAVGVVQDGFDDVDAGHADGVVGGTPYR